MNISKDPTFGCTFPVTYDVTVGPHGGAAAPSFDPLTLFDGASDGLWVKADLISSLYQDAAKTTAVVSGSDPVGAMEDQSGFSNDMKQATTTKRFAYNSSGYVTGDGVDDHLLTDAFSTAWTQAISHAIIFERTGTGDFILDAAVSGRNALFDSGGTSWAMYGGTQWDVTASSDGWHWAIITFDGNSSNTNIDGVDYGPSAAGTLGAGGLTLGAAIGGGSAFAGNIKELISRPSDFTAQEKIDLAAYLTSRTP